MIKKLFPILPLLLATMGFAEDPHAELRGKAATQRERFLSAPLQISYDYDVFRFFPQKDVSKESDGRLMAIDREFMRGGEFLKVEVETDPDYSRPFRLATHTARLCQQGERRSLELSAEEGPRTQFLEEPEGSRMLTTTSEGRLVGSETKTGPIPRVMLLSDYTDALNRISIEPWTSSEKQEGRTILRMELGEVVHEAAIREEEGMQVEHYRVTVKGAPLREALFSDYQVLGDDITAPGRVAVRYFEDGEMTRQYLLRDIKHTLLDTKEIEKCLMLEFPEGVQMIER